MSEIIRFEDEQPAPTHGAELATTEADRLTRLLAELDAAGKQYVDEQRPRKTTTSYARDWAVWCQYLAELSADLGAELPLTSVTSGTLIGFVEWLDRTHQAPPSTIDRRLAGVSVEGRSRGVTITKDTTRGARELLKRYRSDPERMRRGRGQAKAATPAHLEQIGAAAPDTLAGLRDQALALMAFAIAGRASEVSALNVEDIAEDESGLTVNVPPVKGRPGRTVYIAPGDRTQTCPVSAWKAWQKRAGITSGPAFRAVGRWDQPGAGRLSPDGCRIVITRAAERAQIESRLTGHSARRGLITTGREAGKTLEELAAQSGHSVKSGTIHTYIEAADRKANPVTKGIGL